MTTPGLTDYIARHAGRDDALEHVARETEKLPEAGMLSRPDAGALLTMLVRLLDARNAVEVGTFTGYGAICIARGLADGGRLTCFEVSDAAWLAPAEPNAPNSRASTATITRPRDLRRVERMSGDSFEMA